MPDRALQMPYAEDEATEIGRNVFRKQILPVGSIEYEGRTLNFTREYLADLAKNFNAGAFDQVPFQLANDRNEHTFDPEKFRGEVKALELSEDGLYGIVEMTDEGAQVVHKNPKLGVSARIVEGLEKSGQAVGNAIQHVLGTLDPRVTGMKPWEAVNLSESDAGVVDLTDSSFSDPVNGKGLSDTEKQQLAALAAKGSKDEVTSVLTDSAGLSDEDASKIVADLIEDATSQEDKDRQPVAALAAEDRRAIELATQSASDANERARRAEEALAQSHFERTRDDLVAAGVPPADVKLAEPILKGGSGVIELSNGEKLDAHNVITKLLENRRGTIDLTTVGVGAGSAEADGRDPAVVAWARGQTGQEKD